MIPSTTELLLLAASLTGGAGLGLLYFGGLWLTLRRLPRSSRPSLLALGSFLGRTAVVLAGFYIIMDGQWLRLGLALAGFLGMRTLLVRRWGSPQPRHGVNT